MVVRSRLKIVMGNNSSQVSPGAEVHSPVLERLQLQAQRSDAELDTALPPPAAAQQRQHNPLLRRASSKRGYHPRSASLRRMRSIQRRRLLENSNTKSRPPSRRNARMEADNKKRQEEKHLLSACARGDLQKVERLVDCGVDVNSVDKNQMSALHHAAMHSRDEVIKSLISRGAEVTTADLKGGFTAMHWVVINADPQYGSTNHIDKSLSALVKAGCRVNATDFNFATPLHIAAQKGNKGCVQALMRLGADPAKVDITGRNSIEVAKDDQTKALLKRLLEKYSQQKESASPVYQVLETPRLVHAPPPPTVSAPPPPVPPPRLVTAGKSQSEEEHFYDSPDVNVSPPSSPSIRSSSITPPPPPPHRRRQYTQYCNDTHMYHVLEVPPPKPRGERLPSPPRRRKVRKY